MKSTLGWLARNVDPLIAVSIAVLRDRMQATIDRLDHVLDENPHDL